MKKKTEDNRTSIQREQRLEQMRKGRIEKQYLQKLVLDYKFNKQLDLSYPMPRELAEVILIIIDKMLGSGNWRNYSDDWKEEMRGRAIEHVLKYTHNFDPIKSKNDPYNYFAMIISNAFIQSWRKCKNWTDNNISINHEVAHAEMGWSGEDEGSAASNIESITPNTDALDWGYF